MITLFSRTVIIYLTVFALMRLMGKRQLSDMQPFDLVVTLLIADAASEPISDSAVPLFYGILPILSLFILHRLVSFLSLKSIALRTLVCGRPVPVIADGIVLEKAMRAADYTLNDLTEQLRIKDVFSISEAEYAILETNGDLSVLKKAGTEKDGGRQEERPAYTVLSDGRIRKNTLAALGKDREWLEEKLGRMGIDEPKRLFFACIEADGSIYAQEKTGRSRREPKVYRGRPEG